MHWSTPMLPMICIYWRMPISISAYLLTPIIAMSFGVLVLDFASWVHELPATCYTRACLHAVSVSRWLSTGAQRRSPCYLVYAVLIARRCADPPRTFHMWTCQRSTYPCRCFRWPWWSCRVNAACCRATCICNCAYWPRCTCRVHASCPRDKCLHRCSCWPMCAFSIHSTCHFTMHPCKCCHQRIWQSVAHSTAWLYASWGSVTVWLCPGRQARCQDISILSRTQLPSQSLWISLIGRNLPATVVSMTTTIIMTEQTVLEYVTFTESAYR